VLGTCRHGVLIKEDGTQIMTKPHVTNYYSNTVSAIDTSTNKVVTTINFEIGPCAGPWWIAYDSDNMKMYVANLGDYYK
jgi:YVTN family beta-propeller protein